MTSLNCAWLNKSEAPGGWAKVRIHLLKLGIHLRSTLLRCSLICISHCTSSVTPQNATRELFSGLALAPHLLSLPHQLHLSIFSFVLALSSTFFHLTSLLFSSPAFLRCSAVAPVTDRLTTPLPKTDDWVLALSVKASITPTLPLHSPTPPHHKPLPCLTRLLSLLPSDGGNRQTQALSCCSWFLVFFS